MVKREGGGGTHLWVFTFTMKRRRQRVKYADTQIHRYSVTQLRYLRGAWGQGLVCSTIARCHNKRQQSTVMQTQMSCVSTVVDHSCICICSCNCVCWLNQSLPSAAVHWLRFGPTCRHAIITIIVASRRKVSARYLCRRIA